METFMYVQHDPVGLSFLKRERERRERKRERHSVEKGLHVGV
jgi:hypothetical protein